VDAEHADLSSLLLDTHLEAGHGGRTAIRYEGRDLTYAQLAASVGRAASALRQIGVRREDRVAILLHDRPEFVAAFLGAVRIGAVAVPLNTLLQPAETAELLRHCGAVALVAEGAIADRLRARRAELPDLRVALTVGAPEAGDAAFAEACAAAPAELPRAEGRPDDMCFWQYTSGTTGRPKGIVHRHRDLAFATERYGCHVIGMTEEDRSFSVARLFFSYGLGNSLAFPLRYGASAVLHPGRPDPRTVLDIVARERPTLFYAVPTAYAALLAAAEAEPARADLSSVRLCVSAGEALPAPLFERWKARFGHEILDGIGSTEVGYIFVSNVPGQVRPGTSGRAVPGYEAKVADAQGHPLRAGEIGDLWVRGGSTFSEYWQDPERTRATIRDGWVVTGDKYSFDADGYFRYAGRADDMLKIGGIWVAPAVVEAAVCAHPAVLECAVVGRADADGLIKPAAFVVRRPGASVTAEEIVTFVTERIARFNRPRWVHFLADLPKTSTGKVQRYKLRDTAREVPV
jgi:benzoate-CoA ligase